MVIKHYTKEELIEIYIEDCLDVYIKNPYRNIESFKDISKGFPNAKYLCLSNAEVKYVIKEIKRRFLFNQELIKQRDLAYQ